MKLGCEGLNLSQVHLLDFDETQDDFLTDLTWILLVYQTDWDYFSMFEDYDSPADFLSDQRDWIKVESLNTVNNSDKESFSNMDQARLTDNWSSLQGQ